jgi:hypothetical protein
MNWDTTIKDSKNVVFKKYMGIYPTKINKLVTDKKPKIILL